MGLNNLQTGGTGGISPGGLRNLTEISAIPDSVVLQYYATTWSQGDSTWTDDNGVQDMSINGHPQDSSLSDGTDALGFDGTDDYGDFLVPSSLEGSNLNQSTFEIAFETSTSNQARLFGMIGNGIHFRAQLNTPDSGDITVNLEEEDANNDFTFETDNENLNDGNRQNLSIIYNDTTTDDVELIVNGSSVSISVIDSGTFDLSGDSFDRNMTVAALNNGGTIQDYMDGKIGAIRWHNEAISQQTIDDY